MRAVLREEEEAEAPVGRLRFRVLDAKKLSGMLGEERAQLFRTGAGDRPCAYGRLRVRPATAMADSCEAVSLRTRDVVQG